MQFAIGFDRGVAGHERLLIRESRCFGAPIADRPRTGGTLTLNANGSFTYQPTAHFNGTDSFTYQARDNRASPPATVTLTVAPVNDLPVAVGDTYTGDPGVPFVVSAAEGVLANDSDAESSPLTAVMVTGPANGVLQLNPDGSFTFSSTSGFSGNTSFTYLANDGGTDSVPANVTITVGPDHPPVAVNDSYVLD